jgi:integration host factor subunit alpha
MTKADLIDKVHEALGDLTKKQATDIVENVFTLVKETLAAGDNLKISGFGSFVLRYKNQRIGRNPKSGDAMTISARRVVTFKPSQVLKNGMNGE